MDREEEADWLYKVKCESNSFLGGAWEGREVSVSTEALLQSLFSKALT